MYSHRDIVAQVNVDALLHNVAVLRRHCQAGVRICAALKANAYGHGVRIVAPVLAATPISMAAVATLGEAVDLRELGWNKPILLFGPIFADGDPSGRNDRLRAVLDYDLTVTAVDFYGVRDLAHEARSQHKIVRCHVKIDSGMGRMGISPASAVQLAERLHALPNVRVEGVYTHFATADEADKSYCFEQLRVFREALGALQAAGARPWLVHAAATAALLDVPESHFDMVRPGIGLFGLLPSEQLSNKPDLRPVLKVISRLVLVKHIKTGQAVGYGRTWRAGRDSVIGIVPVGYHDGYLRSLGNKAVMTVRGRHAPVVGRINMDQTAVDLTGVPGALVGDPVVVIDDDPAAPNSVANLARIMQTIPYEVTALLGNRVARVAYTSDTPAVDTDTALTEPQSADVLNDASLAHATGLADGEGGTMDDSSLIGAPAAASPRRVLAPAARRVLNVARKTDGPGVNVGGG
jgi:alanine racemase